MSNLIDHARRELALVEQGPDGDREFVASLQAAVHGFATYAGHSGGSHAIAVDWLTRLLRFENIAPLTDDPAEWADVEGEGGVTTMWQNRRCSEAFSADGGRTYWLLSEGAHSSHREPRHLSQHQPTTPTQGEAPDPAPGQGEAACLPAGDERSDGADDHSVGPDAGEATPDHEEGGGVEPDGAAPPLVGVGAEEPLVFVLSAATSRPRVWITGCPETEDVIEALLVAAERFGLAFHLEQLHRASS